MDFKLQTVNKLTSLVNQHPTADMRFNPLSCATSCGAKFISSDVWYDESKNIIYIGQQI